jgi:hypothetical protein
MDDAVGTMWCTALQGGSTWEGFPAAVPCCFAIVFRPSRHSMECVTLQLQARCQITAHPHCQFDRLLTHMQCSQVVASTPTGCVACCVPECSLLPSWCLALLPLVQSECEFYSGFRSSSFRVVASQAWSRGEQVFINYGSGSNDILALQYGFVPQGCNPDDR